MIGLCQEDKSSPDALGRSAGVNSSGSSARRVGLSAGFLFENRTRLPFAGAALLAAQKIEFVFPARVETNRRQHQEFTLLRPVGLTARLGRPRAEKTLFVLPVSGRRTGLLINHQKVGLPAIHPSSRPLVFWPPPGWHDWHCPSVFPGHTAAPTSGWSAGPSWPLRSAWSANVCWKSGRPD